MSFFQQHSNSSENIARFVASPTIRHKVNASDDRPQRQTLGAI